MFNLDNFNESYEKAREIKRTIIFYNLVREHVYQYFTIEEIKQKHNLSWYAFIKTDFIQQLWEEKGAPVKQWLIEEVALSTGEDVSPVAEPKVIKADEPKQADEQPKKTAQMKQEVKRTEGGVTASLSIPIEAILMQAVEQYIPSIEEGLQSRIEEAAKALQPNLIKVAGRPNEVEITGTLHSKFKEI